MLRTAKSRLTGPPKLKSTQTRASAAPARPNLWKVVNSRLGRAPDLLGGHISTNLGSFQALIWPPN